MTLLRAVWYNAIGHAQSATARLQEAYALLAIATEKASLAEAYYRNLERFVAQSDIW